MVNKKGDNNPEVDTKKLLEEINSLKTICQQVRDAQAECLKSQEFINTDYESLKKTQKSILTKLKNVEDKMDKLTKACAEKDKIILTLKKRVISLENHSRRKNIEIHGVFELERESVNDIVVRVSHQLGVPLKKEDIEAAHRVPTRAEGKPKPIIAELKSRARREEIIAAKKEICSTDIVKSSQKGRVFVYAQISPELKSLRWEAKKKAKASNWKFVWIKDCTLLARKSENDRQIIRIESIEDLDKIC